VDEKLARPNGLRLPPQLGGTDPGVDVALAHPHVDVVPAGLPADVRAEELVREEEDVSSGRDRGHDLDRVRGRAADVRFGLHLGAGVDIGDHDGARIFGLPGPELRRGDRIRQGTAGLAVGDEHRPFRAEDLRGLRHEPHPGQHDRAGRTGGGEPGQRQRIADVVGDVLDLGGLVVVRQDHRVPLRGQPPHLVRPARRDRIPAARGDRIPAARREPVRVHQ
jgi:hypothetical protein